MIRIGDTVACHRIEDRLGTLERASDRLRDATEAALEAIRKPLCRR
jgi:hypothetical protein